MQNSAFEDVTRKNSSTLKALGGTAGKLLAALCIGCGAIAPAWADDHSAHSSHDMHSMHDMSGMKGMEHMDHSAHQQSMSKRGEYSVSVKTYAVPELKLVDGSGRKVSLRELTDDRSAVMLNFIFTTCTTICPVMSSTFQQVQVKLGKDQKAVRLVSISIDPENDTPAKLKQYAERYKAGPQWTLLTGSLENSLAAQKAFDVFAGEKMNHKPITFIKAKGAKEWVRLEGLVEADQVIAEYEKLGGKK